MAGHRDKRRDDQRSAYKSVRHRTGWVQRQRQATKNVHKDKREEEREYGSGQCSCDHWAHTVTEHQPHELTRVGAESRANSELASPPRHRITHCSIDSEQGQETRYASYKQQHLADYPSLLGVIVHLRPQRAGKHQHLRIEIARNMFHRRRDGIGITAEANENEITASRNGAQHINARAIGLASESGVGVTDKPEHAQTLTLWRNDLPANRILPRPKCGCERLGDHYRIFIGWSIAEYAAMYQGNADRGEIILRDNSDRSAVGLPDAAVGRRNSVPSPAPSSPSPVRGDMLLVATASTNGVLSRRSCNVR